MEDFRQLQQRELFKYAHMIPRWLMEEALEDDGIEIWGMEDWDEACGAAVISRKPDVVELLHLYIAKDYRNSGRGGRFLMELMYYAYRLGASQFQVKYIMEQFPEMERLLSSYPMQIGEPEMVGNAESTLGELAELHYLKGGYGSVKALSECTKEGLSHLYGEIISKGLDWVPIPLKKEEYLAKYSAVAMESGRPAGLLLVKEAEDGVFIPYMVNLSSNAAAPIEMIRFAVQKGSENLEPDIKCHFVVINETLLALLEKLGMKIQKRRCAALDLSYFEECERNVTAYIEFMQELTA